MGGKDGISQVNVDSIKRQAARIRQIAEDMRHLSNVRLSGSANNISAVWRGEAANRFLSHCAETRDQINAVAAELFEIANLMELEAKIAGG